MKRIYLVGLFLIFALGFIFRLYRFDSPIADWHSWRQADTSSVSRNFVLNGFDLLHPKYDDISNIPSGKDNPEGYRFVEFPIYNTFQAGLYKIFHIFTIEQWGRLVSIFSSLVSGIFIYLIIKKHLDAKTATIASLVFLFLPFSIYYSRSILPDEMMTMAILGGIYFFDQWLNKSIKYKVLSIKYWVWLILALIFTASAFLLKPYALFFTLPMFALSFEKFGLSFLKKWQLWLFVILTIFPLVFWRIWMTQYPEGIPVSNWLFNEGNIRFKGAFFYWIFAERISKLILGYFGVVLLLLGIFKKDHEKNYLFFISFLFSTLLYLFVIARGNVQHDYYQILIIPTLSIFVARGADFLLSLKNTTNKIISYFLLIIIFISMFSFSWYYLRDYFNINNSTLIEAGKAVDNITPKDAKIIVPYNGDTSFLYQTKRKGWPAFEKPVEDLIKMGADYLVLVSPTKDDTESWSKRYEVVSSNSSYLILKLN